jgi:hypothetical protein
MENPDGPLRGSRQVPLLRSTLSPLEPMASQVAAIVSFAGSSPPSLLQSGD